MNSLVIYSGMFDHQELFTRQMQILSGAFIGYFSLSISGETHEFIIYAMPQQGRADNLRICYRKK